MSKFWREALMKIGAGSLGVVLSLCLVGCTKEMAAAGAKIVGTAVLTTIAEKATAKVVDQIDLSSQASQPVAVAAPAWTPGAAHPSVVHVFASDTQGLWLKKAGYAWNNPSNAGEGVHWQPGTAHPEHVGVAAADQEGRFEPAAGYQWVNNVNGDLRVAWMPGTLHSRITNVYAADTEGFFVPGDGYCWNVEGDVNQGARWCPGTASRMHSNVVAGDGPGRWKPAEGFRWVDAENNADMSVVPKD